MPKLLNSAQECVKREVSVYGAIIAAALKAVAACKQVGARGEHYGTTVLMQCRSLLQPPLRDSAIGKHFQFINFFLISNDHELPNEKHRHISKQIQLDPLILDFSVEFGLKRPPYPFAWDGETP